MSACRGGGGGLPARRGGGCLPARTGFPLGLENLEKWEGIFQSGKSQGILNRLEKSGKITQNTGKYWEFQTNIICYFLVIFKLPVYCLLKWIKFSVKKQNIKKILEK